MSQDLVGTSDVRKTYSNRRPVPGSCDAVTITRIENHSIRLVFRPCMSDIVNYEIVLALEFYWPREISRGTSALQ